MRKDEQYVINVIANVIQRELVFETLSIQLCTPQQREKLAKKIYKALQEGWCAYGGHRDPGAIPGSYTPRIICDQECKRKGEEVE